jgi:spore maturation protein A
VLNYIWAALVISSFAFALGHDLRDAAQNTYRNDTPLALTLGFPAGYDPDGRLVPVRIEIDPGAYRTFYGTDEAPAEPFAGTLVQTSEGRQLRFAAGASFPEPLATIHGASQSNDGELQGTLVDFTPPVGAVAAPASVTFETVRFVRMTAIGAAALDFAAQAAEIALGLIGVLTLFLGLLKIAEQAGIVYAVEKLVRPLLRPIFPEIPANHPALGMIALNLTANVFGLGNAATPFGIKAMEELQKLNPTEDTATNSMVMLLAINTGSVQLVPPVLLLALMGLQVNELMFAIWIATFLSLVVAIVAARLYGALPKVRASDPSRLAPPPPSEAA